MPRIKFFFILSRNAPFLWFLARVFVGLVYAYAGFSKLMEPVENFRGAITQFEVLPMPIIPMVAHVLPWVELIVGIFLILGYAPRLSAAGLAVLSGMFLVVLGTSKFVVGSFGLTCGCFGERGIQLSFTQIFLLDIFDFCLAWGIYRRKDHLWSLGGLLGRAR
ncbi:MAG: MauE/DoxX family redox-associated membrane protein [Candidatus Omnitrophota bacterium]|nr:MauE/DoxX family redox-associated membrane protein [Candidatus Omnitrophota bacterium]